MSDQKIREEEKQRLINEKYDGDAVLATEKNIDETVNLLLIKRCISEALKADLNVQEKMDNILRLVTDQTVLLLILKNIGNYIPTKSFPISDDI